MARDAERQIDRGHYVDRSPVEKTTLQKIIERYLTSFTNKRPSEPSRIAVRTRLEPLLRAETDLCAAGVAHLTLGMFEGYRGRRLMELVTRETSRGRGQYRIKEPKQAEPL